MTTDLIPFGGISSATGSTKKVTRALSLSSLGGRDGKKSSYYVSITQQRDHSGSFGNAEATGDDEQMPWHVAHFSIDEIKKGPSSASPYSFDKYSESYLIRSIQQTHTASDPRVQFSRDWLTRRLFVGTSWTKGDCKFVVKHIRPTFMYGSQEEFERAASYLAHEANMMQILRRHPGIVSLLGTSIDSTEAYYTNGGRPDAYFIIHERIVERLEQRLGKWKGKIVRIKAFDMIGGIVWNNNRSEESFMATRLGVALDIADALAYMHRHHVAYRNFGMDKVGFNRNKQVQLIDLGDADKLGLASLQELAENTTTTTTELQENLSTHRRRISFTGSLSSSSRIVALHAYTAPEVETATAGGDEQSFSAKSVSFSFTKLLSEILTLIVVGLNPSRKVTTAYINEFQRISSLLPKSLLQQLHQGASVNPDIRPTMENFAETIKLGINGIVGKNKALLKRSSSCNLSQYETADDGRRKALSRHVSWYNEGSSRRSSGEVTDFEDDYISGR